MAPAVPSGDGEKQYQRWLQGEATQGVRCLRGHPGLGRGKGEKVNVARLGPEKGSNVADLDLVPCGL